MISLDPGIRMLGVAEFEVHPAGHSGPLPRWVLMRAALIRNPVKRGHDLEAAYGIARAAREWASLNTQLFISHVVCEVPQVYGAEHQKGDQNVSVVPMVMVSAMFAALCGLSSSKLVQYLPAQWKDQIDPEVCCKRVEAELARGGELGRVEECPASYRHNVLDAIGVGLKFTGRFEPRRVYPL
jgi:hypothetical protein